MTYTTLVTLIVRVDDCFRPLLFTFLNDIHNIEHQLPNLKMNCFRPLLFTFLNDIHNGGVDVHVGAKIVLDLYCLLF